MNGPVFDDDYTGPRWRYGLQYRPVSGANVPDGWILFSPRPHPDFVHGTVDYPFELNRAMLEKFQMLMITARFLYRNWQGETRWRTVCPDKIWFGSTQWHPQPQWFLHAFDCEKGKNRDFAMRNILEWRNEFEEDAK